MKVSLSYGKDKDKNLVSNEISSDFFTVFCSHSHIDKVIKKKSWNLMRSFNLTMWVWEHLKF